MSRPPSNRRRESLQPGPRLVALEGAYPALRASVLAGVPKSTVYHWARKGVIVPSVSQTKEKLWSYGDLVGLRIVHWLRKQKLVDEQIVAATPMKQVRITLAHLDAQGIDLWRPHADSVGSSPLLVDRSGKVLIESGDGVRDVRGQQALGKVFCRLLGPFDVDGMRGPDLIRPRSHLRIIPGKLSGEPHVEDSRISSLGLYALAIRGLSLTTISSLYPSLSHTAIQQAIELEAELAQSGSAQAA